MSDRTADAITMANRIFSAGVPRAKTQLTMEELDVVRDYVRSKFSDAEVVILLAYVASEEEFRTGHRCGVCGMTGAQTKNLNYNCAEEC